MAFTSATNRSRFLELHEMQKKNQEHNQIRNIGLNSRELAAKACPFCGGSKYQLVFRWDMQQHADGIVRCAECQRMR